MSIHYMGSIPWIISGPEQQYAAKFLRSQLQELRANAKTKPVVLLISLSGIKVCSTDGKKVLMAHALRRVSYASCDPEKTQFLFVAREPRGHFSSQFCHTFLTESPQQAEELNSIVGNAFRLAYAAHLQRQPNLHEVISTQLEDKHLQRANQYSGEQPQTLESQTMDPLTSGGSPTLLVHHKPSSIPGLRAFSHNSQNNNRTDSNQSTPCSEESNSPTELNSYKRLLDKPPLMKRIAMGLNSSAAPDEENCPLVQRNSTNSVEESRPSLHPVIDSDSIKKINLDNRLNQSPGVTTDVDFKLKRMSPISSSGSGSVLNGSDTKIPVPPPPPPPERTDSLCSKIEEELKAAPWFQAGIPREITLEVLGQEPVGSFMVRESTTKPGCFALSLRVPRDFQPLGIAHYLIMRTNKGYKIKGFTKEFTSLTALITHHSVMPELLPCPLSLSRYNPSFTKADTSKDFADIDSDPDYNTLADFRKMMADLNV